jgi:hypothetical protein
MSAAMVKKPADMAAVMPETSANNVPTGGPSLPPLTTNMTASSLTSGGNSCLDEQIERLKRCEYLREGEVKALCLRAREILVDESNVQRVDAPVTVGTHCGRLCVCWTIRTGVDNMLGDTSFRASFSHFACASFSFLSFIRYVVTFMGSSMIW